MAGSRTHARGFQPIPFVTEKHYFVRLFRRTVPEPSLPIPTISDPSVTKCDTGTAQVARRCSDRVGPSSVKCCHAIPDRYPPRRVLAHRARRQLSRAAQRALCWRLLSASANILRQGSQSAVGFLSAMYFGCTLHRNGVSMRSSEKPLAILGTCSFLCGQKLA